MIDKLKAIVGDAHVLDKDNQERYSRDFIGMETWTPMAVVRPANTEQVSAIVCLANETKTPVVPVSGNTGLAGGTVGEGAIMISLERMNVIREIRPGAHIAIVEAGVILANLRAAAEEHDLVFPLTFGAQGSAMIGGNLSTNAGGSNVVKYGNTRDLCLGIEVVLPTGEIMDLMSELHKDNSGYNLKHLMIGAEGTLGIITAAVLKLSPKPRAYATAMVACPSLDAALVLLNKLQEETGGAVEAFEYMPRFYIEQHMATISGAREPFGEKHEINILVEVGATAPRDCTIDENGQTPISSHLEETLAGMFEEGLVVDAFVAQNEAQRIEMWARREAAAEVVMSKLPIQNNDVAVPVDKVSTFLGRMEAILPTLDSGAKAIIVSHLGDGNVHYSVWPSSDDKETYNAIMEAVEGVVADLGGSFSAEHGIGINKLPSMQRRKNKVAMAAMRAVKSALDPNNIMNPGKVLPPETAP